MINWLKKPYFLVSSIKFNVSLSLIIGLFIFLFLYIFKPFGIYSIQKGILTYTFGFGVITFLVQCFVLIIIPRVFKNKFNDENWTVGKNVIFLTFLVLTIAIFNWLYNNNTQEVSSEFPLINFYQMISYTFMVGVFPVLIFTFLSEKIHRERREKNSEKLMKFKKPNLVLKKEKKIIVFGNNKEENISFYLSDLIYISSQGNYASFFLNSDNGVKEHILRNTLTNINSNLDSFSNIIRCHKSYIINSNHMCSIAGNARGYFLTSLLTAKKIPVSRKYSKEKLQDLLI